MIDELPQWFDDMFALQVALWIAILIAVVTTVARVWKPVRRFIAGIDTLFGTGANDALADRLERIEVKQSSHNRKIDTIYREVLPNHGSSLRDQIDGLSERVEEIAAHQERDFKRMQEHLEEAESSQAVMQEIVDKVDRAIESGGNRYD